MARRFLSGHVIVGNTHGSDTLWVFRASEKLFLVLMTFTDFHCRVANRTVAKLVDQNERFAGSASQTSSPVGDHLNLATPLLYGLAFAVEDGKADSGIVQR